MSYYKVGSTLVPGLTTTVGDREDLLRQLHTEFVQLRGDLFRAMGWRTDSPSINPTNPLWTWYVVNIQPTMNEWQDFYDGQVGSWYEKFRTDWSKYVDWQKRLKALRQAAKDKLATVNAKLESPEPSDVPESPWSKVPDWGNQLGNTVKTVAFVGLGIGGLILVNNLARK